MRRWHILECIPIFWELEWGFVSFTPIWILFGIAFVDLSLVPLAFVPCILLTIYLMISLDVKE